MSSSSGHDKSSTGKSPMLWAIRIFVGIFLLAALILLLKGCSGHDSTTSSAGNQAPVNGRSVGGGNVQPAAVGTYTIEVPKGKTIHMPSKDDSGWSDPAPGKAGFQLMRNADRGRGSYDTEHLPPNSNTWLPGISFDETAEHYRSKGDAQDIEISYLPFDPDHPRR